MLQLGRTVPVVNERHAGGALAVAAAFGLLDKATVDICSELHAVPAVCSFWQRRQRKKARFRSGINCDDRIIIPLTEICC